MKRVLKWIGIALGSLIGLTIGVGTLYVVGGSKLKAKHEVPAERELVVQSETTARHIAFGYTRLQSGRATGGADHSRGNWTTRKRIS